MRQRGPDFWAKVRTVNWILGGVGMLGTGFSYSLNSPREIREPRPMRSVIASSESLSSRMPNGLPLNAPGNFLRNTVNFFAFTGDDRTLIGSGSPLDGRGNRRELHAWDVASGKKLWTRVVPGPVDSDSILSALMPDRQSLVTVRSIPIWKSGGDTEGRYHHSLRLEILDARTGLLQNQGEETTRQEAAHPPVSVDVAPDGRTIAVACADGIVLWQVRKDDRKWKRRILPRSDGQHLPISRAQFTADGRHLVVLSADWDLPKGRDADKNLWADAGVWDVRTGVPVRTFGETTRRGRGGKQFHYSSVMAALSSDRRRVVTFSLRTHRFLLWDIASGKRLRESPPVTALSIAGASNLSFVAAPGLLAARRGDTVSVQMVLTGKGYTPSTSLVYWDTAANRFVMPTRSDVWGPAHIAALSSDGKLAATAWEWYEGHTILLREARSGVPVRPLALNGAPRQFRYSGGAKENAE